MNIESLQIKGQLAEAKRKFKDLDAESSGLVILIRSLLSPYEEDMTKLESEKALSSTKRLDSVIRDMKSLKTQIAKLEAYFE